MRLKLAEGKGELRITAAMDVEEPVAQEQPGGVRPRAEGGGDIVRVVKAGFIVLGPARRQEVVAHLAPVERQLVLPQAAHVHERPPEVRLDGELPAQQHGFVGGLGAFQVSGLVGVGCADPLRARPIGRAQHAHRPLPYRAPGRGRAGLIPHPDLPPDGLVRDERLAGVGHLDGPVGGHLAGIPQVAAVGGQQGGRGGRDHLVGALGQTVRGGIDGLQQPVEPRVRGVDAQRIDAVFATHPRDLQAARAVRRRGRERKTSEPRGQDRHFRVEAHWGVILSTAPRNRGVEMSFGLCQSP